MRKRPQGFQAVQSQMMARGLKFLIKKVEGLCYIYIYIYIDDCVSTTKPSNPIRRVMQRNQA